VCRSAAGVCDLAENCTGASAQCPPDTKSTAVCRAAAGPCDVAESCNGSSESCPPGGFQPSTTGCRSAAGGCDGGEKRTGAGARAGPAGTEGQGAGRQAGGPVGGGEGWQRFSDRWSAEGLQPSTTVCRSAAGVCDVAESCTGTGAACPADTKSTDICRAAAGA